MAYSESGNRASIKYKSSHIKRIPLDVQLEMYDRIKEASLKAGESVNGFIKKAIENRIIEMQEDVDQ